MSENVPGVSQAESLEANRKAYEQLSVLVATRTDQLPDEAMEKLVAVTFTLGSDDMPNDMGRTRIDSIRIELEPNEKNLRIQIRNPLFGRSGTFDLTSDGGCYGRPGGDVWDEAKQEVVPRALTPSWFNPKELISRLDVYLPVLERLPAYAELELRSASPVPEVS